MYQYMSYFTEYLPINLQMGNFYFLNTSMLLLLVLIKLFINTFKNCFKNFVFLALYIMLISSTAYKQYQQFLSFLFEHEFCFLINVIIFKLNGYIHIHTILKIPTCF